MNKAVLAVVVFLACGSSFAATRSWTCTYNGHKAEVSFDESTRMMRVTSDGKITDEGMTVKRTTAGSDLVEYSMGYSNLDYAYYLRLNGRDAELHYCWSCAAYACEAK